MRDLSLSRREVLQAAGVSILGTAALSAMDPVRGHESYETSAQDRISPTLIRPRPEEGFNYPYFLYAPEPPGDDERPILVEPNNTGATTDDYQTHLTRADGLVKNGNGRTLSEAVKVPLVVPVFPRSKTDPVGGNTYTHALDVDTLAVTSGEAARIDEQLLAMVDHAAALLSEMSYPVQSEEILMHGFSASGNFVNRFPAVHPERVSAVTAGGINGTAVLPISDDKGHTLNFHIGIADMESLVGHEFDLEAFAAVEQYIYMGSEDDNDTIPYSDAWDPTQREIALDVYGEDMQEDRMPYCESVYDSKGVAAEFRIYEGVGHRTTAEMMGDLVEFHRRNVGISTVGFSAPPTNGNTSVALETTVESDASDSFEARVFDGEGTELTESPPTVATGESVDAHVDLTRELQTDETVRAAVLPAGVTDPAQAVADAETTVIDTARATVERPTAGERSLAVEYAIDSEYETSSPIHFYAGIGENSEELIGTVRSTGAGATTFRLDAGTAGVPFVAGDDITVRLKDVDRDESLATAETTVAKGSGLVNPARVAFSAHPTYDDTEITLDYGLDPAYQVRSFVGLYLQTGENAPLLLDQIAPGESGKVSFPIEKYPFEAADDAVLTLADGDEQLASAEALVLVRTDSEDDGPTGDISGAMTVQPTTPAMGESVAFDATESTSPNGEILSYGWAFGDGSTATGSAVEHTYTETGTYTVSLELVDEAGVSATVERQVGVEEGAAEDGGATTAGETTAGTDSTDGADGPGFGVVSTLSGLAAAGYLLRRRNSDDPTRHEE